MLVDVGENTVGKQDEILYIYYTTNGPDWLAQARTQLSCNNWLYTCSCSMSLFKFVSIYTTLTPFIISKPLLSFSHYHDLLVSLFRDY